MTATDLELKIMAYFLMNGAGSVNIDGRFRRREEFMQTFEDAVFFSTQNVRGAAAGRHTELCCGMLDELIEKQCLVPSHDKWSGTSYQFDAARYRAFIQEQIDANPICQQAQAKGPGFWQEVFRSA